MRPPYSPSHYLRAFLTPSFDAYRSNNEPRSPTSLDFADAPYRGTNGARGNNTNNNNSANGSNARPNASGKQNGARSRLSAVASANDASSNSNAVNRRTGSNLLDMVASRGGGGGNGGNGAGSGRGGAFDEDDYASSAGPSGALHDGDEYGHHRNGYGNGSGRAAAHRGRATVAAAAADYDEYDADLAEYNNSHRRGRGNGGRRNDQHDEFDDVDGENDDGGSMGDADIDADLEDPGDIVGDPDEKRYCYCNRISFGQMVGCDDETCEKEWVRLLSPLRLCSLVYSLFSLLCVFVHHDTDILYATYSSI